MGVYVYQKDGVVARADRKNYSRPSYTHYHKGHEIYYLLRGKTKYCIGNEIYYLEKGNMVFVPKGVLHVTDNEECGDISRILVTFTDDMLDDYAISCLSELYNDKFVCFSDENLPKIEELLKRMELESKRTTADREYLIRLYIREFIILISRYRIHRVKAQLSDAQVIIKKVTDYINENYDKTLLEEETSKIFAMSRSHFSRKFKSVTGLRYSEYVTNVRITNSEKLLRETRRSITEIAQQCGFNDSNYFASVFKRLKGITPYKYAKLYRNGEN